MKNHRFLILFSYSLLLIIISLIFLDLSGVFSYTDVPYLIAFALYILFLFIQKSTSKVSFVMTLFLLLFMGMSYVPTGPGRITERIGEWFYLFFVFGLIHYIKEAWRRKTI